MDKDYSLLDSFNTNNITNLQTCLHTHINPNNKCCTYCGIEINNDIQYSPEMCSNSSSSRKYNNPSRCHIRKNEEKNIYKDVASLNIPDTIIKEANTLYQHVVGTRIFRGNTRKSIIFACIFYAYKQSGQPQSCDSLTTLFNIERKDGLKGLKIVNLNSDNNIISKSTYITPENIISEIMKKFSANDSDIQQVILLHSKVYKRSEILNRARPQSVAAGLIRYYILKHNKNIPMKDFTPIVGISELTINRIVKEISKILDS
jgi:transcription initiation factor TFIIIB Brf1 subunit/transcription initiation factor TFIIB